MSDRALQHRRVHNLLLIQKLLGLREGSSPFTLVLDSAEQSARPLVQHYIQNAKTSKANIIFVSYETLTPPPSITTFIKARRKAPLAVQREILAATVPAKRTLLIIDTLHPLLTTPTPGFDISTYLSTLLTAHATLLALHHPHIPLPPSPPSSNPYSPSPESLLRYLATTILTTHSFAQTLTRRRAADRSLPAPQFGLGEDIDGCVVGLGRNDTRGLVVEMEHRRKSGRGVDEWLFFPPPAPAHAPTVGASLASSKRAKDSKIMLLDDHPLYARRKDDVDVGERSAIDRDGGAGASTFDLGLTDKQRRDREGVVLPYFDAQSREGSGEGGRILYDMGVEDDFDEEEDEI